MDATTWYYASGEDQKGPLTVDQVAALIKSNVITRNTFVWTEKFSDWMPISQTELAPLLSRLPSPPVSRAPALGGGGTAVAGPANFAPYQNQTVASSGPAADIMNAVKICFAKFVTWQGRASRPEFWYFVLFSFVVGLCASVVDTVASLKFGGAGVLGIAANLVFFLPSLAVGIRRLHDTGRSGWWYWICLVPLAGVIVLIVFFCQKGTPGQNQFGEPTTLEPMVD